MHSSCDTSRQLTFARFFAQNLREGQGLYEEVPRIGTVPHGKQSPRLLESQKHNMHLRGHTITHVHYEEEHTLASVQNKSINNAPSHTLALACAGTPSQTCINRGAPTSIFAKPAYQLRSITHARTCVHARMHSCKSVVLQTHVHQHLKLGLVTPHVCGSEGGGQKRGCPT